MSDRRHYTREFVIELVDLYRSHPCLWKVKSKEYRDRRMKSEAYKILVKKYQEVQPGADRAAVARKINALRTSYRKERQKVLQSVASGDEVYKPTLWYYSLLEFLSNQEAAVGGHEEVSNMIVVDAELVDATKMLDCETFPEVQQREVTVCGDTTSNRARREAPNRSPSAGRRPRQKWDRPAPGDSVLYLIGDRVSPSRPEDQFDIIGKNVAAKLRRLNNEQRIYAEKKINDALFEAELDSLDRPNCRIQVECAQITTLADDENDVVDDSTIQNEQPSSLD